MLSCKILQEPVLTNVALDCSCNNKQHSNIILIANSIHSRLVVYLSLMQYTREPRCFTSRPAFSQLVKNSVSSSFPILRLQLIKNAGQGSPSVPSSKWYHSGTLINQFLIFVDLQEKQKKKNITIPSPCSFLVRWPTWLSFGL